MTNKPLNQLIVGLVAVQLAFGPLVSSRAFATDSRFFANEEGFGDDAPVSQPTLNQRHFLDAAGEIENAEFKSLPRQIPDVFHLTNQATETESGRVYELAALDATPPSLVAPDFDRDVKVEINKAERSLSLNMIVDGKIKARHIIRNLDVVTFAKDREFLTFLDRSGKLFAIDMGYAKSEAFRTPLPVVELVNSGIPADRMDGLRAAYISRGLKPLRLDSVREGAIVPLDKDANLTAGDLVIYTDGANGRIVEGIFDRSVIATQMTTAEGTLATLAFAAAPSENSDTMLKELSAVQGSEETRTETAAASDQMMTPEKEALSRMSADAVAALLARAKRNKVGKGETRDRFSLAEWSQHFKILHEQAVSELAKSDPQLNNVQIEQLKDWKGLNARYMESIKNKTPLTVFQKVMSSTAIKIIAATITTGGAIAGANHLLQGNGPESLAWLTHYISIAYQNYWPEVLKDAAYRVTLLKSSIALTAFVPLLWGYGKLMNKLNGTTQWDAWKGVAASGMRIYAAIILPFHHRIAQLLRQPNFIRALQLGINPLIKVSAESDVGKLLGLKESIHPGVVNPIQGSKAFTRDVEHKETALKALSDQKNRVKSLTWSLALLVASEKTKIDPATLTLLAQKGGQFDAKELEKLSNSPEFIKEWTQIAEELQFSLRGVEAFGITSDVSKINTQELASYYETAKNVAKNIDSRSGLESVVMKLRMKWNSFSQKFKLGLGNYALEEYKFLKGAEPSQRDVVDQFSKQFQMDYYLAVVQMGLVGARADMSKTSALAADPNGPLWTNKGHLADMADQVRIYGINVPAANALVYQRTYPVRDASYDPVEQETLKGKTESQGLIKGLVEWTKGAVNIPKANYGGIWKRDLIKRMKTIQASILMIIGSRVLLGGQSMADAVPAFAFLIIWANWQFGWIWTPINQGNILYQDEVEAKANILTDAKSKLGAGLRLDSSKEWFEGYKDLLKLYDEAGSDIPAEIEKSASDAIAALDTIDLAALENLQVEMKATQDATSSLREALLSGSAEQIGAARSTLEEIYLKAIPATTKDGQLTREAITHLNAISLLEHALKNPPYAAAAHPGVEWFTIWSGAVLTTYLATSLSVLSFTKNLDWGHLLTKYGMISTGLYLSAFGIQKAANWLVIGDNWKIAARKTVAASALSLLISAQTGMAQDKNASLAERIRTIPEAVLVVPPRIERSEQTNGGKPTNALLLLGCESSFL